MGGPRTCTAGVCPGAACRPCGCDGAAIAHRSQVGLAAVGIAAPPARAYAPLPIGPRTAKPAVVPVTAGALKDGPELNAANAVTGTKATVQVLRSLMAESGVEVLTA